MVRNKVTLPDNKGALEGEVQADPSLSYRLMNTEAEGWVISHTDANTLRPGPDAPGREVPPRCHVRVAHYVQARPVPVQQLGRARDDRVGHARR